MDSFENAVINEKKYISNNKITGVMIYIKVYIDIEKADNFNNNNNKDSNSFKSIDVNRLKTRYSMIFHSIQNTGSNENNKSRFSNNVNSISSTDYTDIAEK